MRLFLLELKRVLKTRTNCILIVAALFVTLLCAWLPVTFQAVLTTDNNGNEIRLKGLDAIHWFQEHDILQGELTAEKIAEAVVQRQNLYREYNSEYGENIPENIYYEKLWPYESVSRCSLEVMADNVTGIVPEYLYIDPTAILSYYSRLEDRLAFVIRSENDGNSAAVKAGLDKFNKVEKPYAYYYGVDSNNMDYEILMMIPLTLICAFICSTVFSSDAQTGANDIQLCTKHGTLPLTLSKIAASGLICSVLFIVCSVVFIMLTSLFFGKQSLLTSVQSLYSVTCLPHWNMGEMMWGVMWYTLLFVVCTVSFTFLVSALCRKNANAVCISLLSAIAPVLVYVAVPEKIEKWLQCFLPSGGIGLVNSVLYMLTDYEFLSCGSTAVWQVDAILLVTAVEIPIFIALTVFTVKKHACTKN